MQNTNIKNISSYNLSELGNLLAELQNRISDYIHISEFVPKNVTESIELAFREVMEEEKSRENQN